jgi:DNA-directed RNA polymerase specialized sigma24 family protein
MTKARPKTRRRNADDAGQGILRREQRDHLQVLLSRLPDAQHEVIHLAFYGELSHAEIADRCGCRPERSKLACGSAWTSLTTDC